MESKNIGRGSSDLKDRTASGLFWSAFGNGAQQIVTMLTGIALARLLRVEDYGLVALLTVFSIIAGTFRKAALPPCWQYARRWMGGISTQSFGFLFV